MTINFDGATLNTKFKYAGASSTGRFRACLIAGLSTLMLLGLTPPSADAAVTSEPPTAADVAGGADRSDEPSAVAGGRWISAEPGPDGLEIVVGSGAQAPRVVARLSVGGMESRLWTGYACLTGSGRFVAAVFAPSEFAGAQNLRDRGAFLAVIDLSGRGAVHVVDVTVALKYHSPGCGPADEIAAVRHQSDAEGAYQTEIIAVDGATGSVDWRTTQNGKLSWPAPAEDRVLVAGGSDLLAIEPGGSTTLLTVEGDLVDVHATPAGADFSIVGADRLLEAKSLTGSGVSPVARGKVGDFRWSAGLGGVNRLLATAEAEIIDADRVAAVEAIPASASLDGEIMVSDQVPGAAVADGDQILHTDEDLTFTSLANEVCAVPRNDPSVQVVQPSPEQVEWAAHRAVRGELLIRRPANWQNNGLSSYVPQQEFPPVSLLGGGRIPAQILLGVLAQESNFWQAARGALPGVAANPLIGNYYGAVYSDGRIVDFDFADADCGYGVGQITDGMRLTDTGQQFRSAAHQKMIATDYTANIAEAQRILAQKWNLLYDAGLISPGTDPALVENWYLPLWAYNCCYYGPPFATTGMGWTNNPANSDYKFDRRYFMRDGLDDAKRPGDWSYPERVFGFVEQGLWLYGERAFQPIDGILAGLPVEGQQEVPYPQPVDRFAFCDASNSCDENYFDPTNISGGVQPIQGDKSFCTLRSRMCWWNNPIPYVASIAQENAFVYNQSGGADAPEPLVGNPYPASCQPNDSAMPEHGVLTSIPSNAVIVDDVPAGTPNVAGCSNVKTAGSFSLSYGADIAQVDTHQVGTGYGGHFQYSHTNWTSRPDHTVTGTWRPPASTTGWQRILVHVPVVGADTYQADYQIFDGREGPGAPANHHRVVNQRWNENRWIDLGVFDLAAGARIELSNVTYSDHGTPVDFGNGPEVDEYYTEQRAISIAWDAVAFIPASRPTVAMVSFGDSYSSGEGNTDNNYFPNTDIYKNSSNTTNACHRTPEAYGPLAFADLDSTIAGVATYSFIACSGATLIDNAIGRDTHWGENPQIDTGWVDDNTTHITLGLGGNDVRFAEVLKSCLTAMTGTCHYELVEYGGETITVDERLRRELAALEPEYRDLVGRLRQMAADARIVLVGYPYVIEQGDFPSTCTGFSDAEIEWLRSSTDRINTMLGSIAASNDNVELAPIMNAYLGHGACASDQYINDIDIEGCGACRDTDVLIAGSFHPNAKGHAAAAPYVIDALKRPSGSNTAPGTIEGRFWKRNESRPITGQGPVRLFEANGDDSRGPLVATTETDANAAYRFPGLAPGCYVVAFTAPPGDVFDTSGLPELDVVGCVQNGETRVIDAQLLAGAGSNAIIGRVSLDGERVAGVKIELYRSNENGDQLVLDQETVTGDNSIGPNYRFEVAELDPPCWLLRFFAPPGAAFEDGGFEHDEHRCIGTLFETTVNVDLVESSTPTVSVESQLVTETDRQQTVRVRFRLDRPATVPVRVRYATADGTAEVNSDYRRKSGTVRFARGQLVKTVSFYVLGDRVAEDPESFEVKLSQPVGARLGSDGLIAINDDDGPDNLPVVSVEDMAVLETDRQQTIRVRFTLDRPATRTVRVRYTTVDGTATVNDDYRRRAGTVRFNRGQISKTVPFYVRGDRIAEPAELFTVALSSPTAATLGSNGTIVINDDD